MLLEIPMVGKDWVEFMQTPPGESQPQFLELRSKTLTPIEERHAFYKGHGHGVFGQGTSSDHVARTIKARISALL